MPKFKVTVREEWYKDHEVEVEAVDEDIAAINARHSLLSNSDIDYDAAHDLGLSYEGLRALHTESVGPRKYLVRGWVNFVVEADSEDEASEKVFQRQLEHRDIDDWGVEETEVLEDA